MLFQESNTSQARNHKRQRHKGTRGLCQLPAGGDEHMHGLAALIPPPPSSHHAIDNMNTEEQRITRDVKNNQASPYLRTEPQRHLPIRPTPCIWVRKPKRKKSGGPYCRVVLPLAILIFQPPRARSYFAASSLGETILQIYLALVHHESSHLVSATRARSSSDTVCPASDRSTPEIMNITIGKSVK